MADIFNTKDSVFFVGGYDGIKAGHPYSGGCTKEWYDASFTNLTDIMSTNGAPLSMITNGIPSGGDTLNKTGEFADAEAGMVAYLSGTDVAAPGRYEILSADANSLLFPAGTFVGTTADVICNVGGAFENLQDALDETDAANYKVEIHTNKDETVSTSINADTGGAATLNKWIIGIDDNGVELTKGNYVTIDGDGTASNCLGIFGIVIGIKNIRLTNAVANSLYFYSFTKQYGYRFQNCKFDSSPYGYRASFSEPNGLIFTDCIFADNSTYDGYGGYNGLTFINCMFDSGPSIHVYAVYGVLLLNCTFISGLYGIYCAGSETYEVINCTFYNQATACVSLNGAGPRFVEYNNIFMPATHNVARAIEISYGEIVYSDYSCAFSVDGNAMDSGYAWPIDYKGDNSIEVDPLFVDTANDDYTPRNPNVLHGGKPDINGNPAQMGAIFVPQHFSRGSRAFNPGRLSTIRN